jgi:hypothetical protein
MRQEETASWTEVIKEEQFLFFTNLAVIPFRRLSEELLIFVELLLGRERDTVDALEGVVVRVTQEIGC